MCQFIACSHIGLSVWGIFLVSFKQMAHSPHQRNSIFLIQSLSLSVIWSSCITESFENIRQNLFMGEDLQGVTVFRFMRQRLVPRGHNSTVSVEKGALQCRLSYACRVYQAASTFLGCCPALPPRHSSHKSIFYVEKEPPLQVLSYACHVYQGGSAFRIMIQLQRLVPRGHKSTVSVEKGAPQCRLSYACRVYQAASTFLGCCPALPPRHSSHKSILYVEKEPPLQGLSYACHVYQGGSAFLYYTCFSVARHRIY